MTGSIPPPSAASTAHFVAVAADLGIALTPARLAQAEQTHVDLRPSVIRLRGLALPFVDSSAGPVDEPGHALAIIAAGRAPEAPRG